VDHLLSRSIWFVRHLVEPNQSTFDFVSEDTYVVCNKKRTFLQPLNTELAVRQSPAFFSSSHLIEAQGFVIVSVRKF